VSQYLGPPGWIRTWKGIARYIDCSVRTAKTLHYKYGMPVHRLPGNTPAIIPWEMDQWLVEYNRLRKMNIAQD